MTPRHLATLALHATLAWGLTTLPALAASTSSATSSASSASVGSASDSLGTSSNSSSQTKDVAQGPYTVLEVAELAEQPHLVQLRLQAMAATPDATAREWVLKLPRETLVRVPLATGDTVLAQHRPYGLALSAPAVTGQAQPFFLVLDDAWHRELDSRPVGS